MTGTLRKDSVLGVTAALLLSAWSVLKFLFWEPSNVAQDSWIYRLKVPSAARQVALPGASSGPTYDVRLGDGPAPSYALIRYRTRASFAELATLFQSDGFSCVQPNTCSLECEGSKPAQRGRQVSARCSTADRASLVTIYVPDES